MPIALLGLFALGFASPSHRPNSPGQENSQQERQGQAALGELWRIGTFDGKAGEFGLAPGGYERYRNDSLLIIGRSKPGELAYALPGPNDNWAGNAPHSAEFVFAVDKKPTVGDCVFTVALTDSHPSSPPELQLLLNGEPIDRWPVPAGSGDDVILGARETGHPTMRKVRFPAAKLKAGNNVLELRSTRGSWIVFDAFRFEAPEGLRLAPVADELRVGSAPSRQAILRTPNGPRQPVMLDLVNIGPERDAEISIGTAVQKVHLAPGRQSLELSVPPVKRTEKVSVIARSGDLVSRSKVELAPVRPWTVYLFPHSHVDIGYTGLQSEILQMHERNLTDALAVARENTSSPSDSRFRFHTEATWVFDRFLDPDWRGPEGAGVSRSPETVREVEAGLKSGTLGLSAGYANLLTGIMHPEELMQSYRYSRLLQERLGIDLDTASQTDVPGVTWGDVVALHEAGVRNLVLMPNAGDRVGRVHQAWQDRPFWWIGPSGNERILVWQTDPYSVGVRAGWNGDRSQPMRTDHPERRFLDPFIFQKLERLAREDYPYDIIGEPWSVQDNAPIDADVPIAAKAWNEKYVTPHVVISSLSDACAALTKRYGKALPQIKGDYTPYWEDGAGSSAAETAMNRHSVDLLIQSETLYAMDSDPAGGKASYPAQTFLEAWRNVLLYSEHTWGADVSVWQPDSPKTKEQWAVKQAFAHKAHDLSDEMFEHFAPKDAIAVSNTNSWPRTDLVLLSAERSRAGDRVENADGEPIPSQRLSSGELAVLIEDLPPFSSRAIRVVAGAATSPSTRVSAAGSRLDSPEYTLELDPKSGAIAKLSSRAQNRIVNDGALGQFLYLPDTDPKGLTTTRCRSVEVLDAGPLVATLRTTSDAPGAKSVVQTYRAVAGIDRIELTTAIDKLPIRTKEGVHIAFPFSVPGGEMRIDTPWAVIQPERDQIRGANKNWMTTQGYVDVSNPQFGVSCVSVDAPLVEVGEISANLLGSVGNPEEWRKSIAPTQRFYSWALNNHWHTNYRADQEGLLTFRYAIQAHGAFGADAASRFATDLRQPLLVTSAPERSQESLLLLDEPTILVTRIVPSDDDKAIIVRLWNTSATTKTTNLSLRAGFGPIFRSDLTQRARKQLGSRVSVPGWGVVTLRIERR